MFEITAPTRMPPAPSLNVPMPVTMPHGGILCLQRAFDRDPEAGKFAGIGAEQVAVQFFEVGEERVDEGAVAGRFSPFVLLDHFLDAQIAIRDRQPVPEVLATADRTRRDATVVTTPVLLRLQMQAEQAFEQERDDDEQRIRQVREAGLLPLLDRAEKIGAARRLGDAQKPAEKLAAQPFDHRVVRRPFRRAPFTAVRAACASVVSSSLRDGALRQRPRGLGFFGDRIEVLDDLVVHRIEQQQVFAFGDEVVAQTVVDEHIEHGDVARLRGSAPPLPARRDATSTDRRESAG